MYAVVQLAGHQHRVEKNQVILADLTGNAAGSEFACKDVLAVGEPGSLKFGKPFVSGASVKFKVLEDLRGKKIRGFRYRRRKGTHKTWGHRQNLQKLQVVDISG